MGSGYKTFTAGAVLTASDVQNYLQDQSVMVFGGTAARSSAIGTANFEEGMLTYLTDVDKLQVYTGATFADVYPPATSNQGMTLINTTAFSGVSSFSLPANTFTSTYNDYLLLVNFTGASTNLDVTARVRASGSDFTSGAYDRGGFSTILNTTTVTSFNNVSQTSWLLGAVNSTYPTYSQWSILFKSPNTTNAFKAIHAQIIYVNNTGNGQVVSSNAAVSSATQYDSASLIASTGNFTGNYSVYGYNK
jgi:hypothetical protein